jgi:mannose-6-phosphate isomerase-like protein (cupin superfamily)
VYRSWEQECDVRYSDGLRIIRFLWADELLPQEAGATTRGPLVARAPTRISTENQGVSSLHVFGDQGTPTVYHDKPVMVRPVDVSPDGRHISFYGVLPEGVAFTEYPGDLGETFYIVKGSIRCTPKGGEEIEWTAGDLVYWPYDNEIELEYSVGLGCICWFWSAQRLPDFTGGVSEAAGRS